MVLHRFTPLLLVFVAFCAIAAACGADTVSQSGAPRIISSRQQQTTTLLWDGRVLVLGGRGQDGEPLASGEIYDPAAALWTAVTSMGTPRYGHTASVLLDGRVLVVGGSDCRRICSEADAFATAEIFDPRTDTWAQAMNMHVSRTSHAAVVLSDGRVLVAGGRGIDPALERPPVRYPPSLRSVELYDPRTGRWTPAEPMHRGRANQAAAALWDGRVVMAGGFEGTVAQSVEASAEEGPTEYGLTPETVEIYDSVSSTWTLSPRAPIKEIDWIGVRADGVVLALGGLERSAMQAYDPGVNRWLDADARDRLSVDSPTIVLLDDQRILSSGGFTTSSTGRTRASVQVSRFDAGAEQWVAAAPMTVGRARHTAIRLPDGSVLVYGGHQYRDRLFGRDRAAVITSEIYDPLSNTWSARGPSEP